MTLLADQWRLHHNHRRIQRALGKLTSGGICGGVNNGMAHFDSRPCDYTCVASADMGRGVELDLSWFSIS